MTENTITREEFEALWARVDAMEPAPAPSYVFDARDDIAALRSIVEAQEAQLRKLWVNRATVTEEAAKQIERRILANIDKRIQGNGTALAQALGETIRDERNSLKADIASTAAAASRSAEAAARIANQQVDGAIARIKAHSFRFAHATED